MRALRPGSCYLGAEAGGLPVKAAIELAERMAACNRYLIQAVIDRFVARISGTKGR
ncbi:MAG: hypothetical protein V3V08_04700 [Nannocystaceae bacterium]